MEEIMRQQELATKRGLTELVFILDKSGSMAGQESDTIGGFNSMLAKQKAEPGEAFVTTVLFDHGYELLHERIGIQAVPPITGKEYQVGGTTALNDAVCATILAIQKAQQLAAEGCRPEQTLFVIITDGEENASQEFTTERVKEMIERQKEEYGWEFIFLGANIDSIKNARDIGIDADNAQDYFDEIFQIFNEKVSKAVSSVRGTGKVGTAWRDIISENSDSCKVK